MADWETAMEIILGLANDYGLGDLHQWLDPSARTAQSCVFPGWPTLQALLLRDMVYLTAQLQDYRELICLYLVE